MATKHTPGPWEWVDYRLGPKIKDPTAGAVHTILEVENFAYGYVVSPLDATLAEDKANRNLIAAAPDLLEALQNLLPVIEGEVPGVTERMIRAAIAKATGDE